MGYLGLSHEEENIAGKEILFNWKGELFIKGMFRELELINES
jgi:hypothetical protein